jgi:hypothetical protein
MSWASYELPLEWGDDMRLLNASSTVLTTIITSCIPRQESIKIENKLLNGSLTLQTIGDPFDLRDLEVIVTEASLILLNEIESTGESVTLEMDGQTYTGPIRKPPQWSVERPGVSARRLYRGTFTMIVDSEGVVT